MTRQTFFLDTDLTSMLDQARIHLAWKDGHPLYRKHIKSTPLENDIPVWMVEFANLYLKQNATLSSDATLQPPAAVDEEIVARAILLSGDIWQGSKPPEDFLTRIMEETEMGAEVSRQAKAAIAAIEQQFKSVRTADRPASGVDEDMVGAAIESVLMSARLQHTRELGDEDNGLPLLDALTPEDDDNISRGRYEINLLVDSILDAVSPYLHPQPAPDRTEGVEASEEDASRVIATHLTLSTLRDRETQAQWALAGLRSAGFRIVREAELPHRFTKPESEAP